MKSRTSEQRDDDEKTLVVLSNRIAKHACLPLWTICSAQQAIESKMGQKNIIADDRLKFAGLLHDERNYYDIVLTASARLPTPTLSTPISRTTSGALPGRMPRGRRSSPSISPFFRRPSTYCGGSATT